MWNITAVIPHVETYRGSTLRSFALLTLACSVIFTINYRFPGSYLGNDRLLARELRSSIDSVYLWRLADEVPFKYRMLFAGAVIGTWTIWRDNEHDNTMFTFTYRVLTFLCFSLAVLTFYLLLTTLGFNTAWSLGGAIVYLLLPPMSMAFTYPVHTKEDLLGFVLLNTGLISFFKKYELLFIIICVLGVFCRETLLILPFIYLFYSGSSLLRRILFAVIPFAIFIGIRWVYGFDSYDVFGIGFMRNMEFLFQSLAFLFISFNVLWVLFFLKRSKDDSTLHFNQNKMLSMSMVVFMLIFFTAFLGGRIMELRLIFLAAPWIITSSLIVLRPYLESMIRESKKQFFLRINVICGILLTIIFWLAFQLRPATIDIMKPVWWLILFLSCHASVILIATLSIIRRKTTANHINEKILV